MTATYIARRLVERHGFGGALWRAVRRLDRARALTKRHALRWLFWREVNRILIRHPHLTRGA